MTMTTDSPIPSPNLLTRLSASPASSTSSLTSSSSFDPHADPAPGESSKSTSTHNDHPQVLGLRELARMRRYERRSRREAKNQTQGKNEVRLISVIGPGTDLPFAKEVDIKGWRVVGGKSWTDLGRIGAYVGQCSSCWILSGAHL